MQSSEPITFSFGENWQHLLLGASEETFNSARKDLEEWLGANTIQGKRVLDIGSGSGIHSLGFLAAGAAEIVSFDLDPRSVEATKSLWERASKPNHWTVLQGSALDQSFLKGLGWESFDLVYAWGVLHHTGAMWNAVDNALHMVKPGGLAWLALYRWTPSFPSDLEVKRRYNAASPLRKRLKVYRCITTLMWRRCKDLKNPLGWNEKRPRGMDVYHDILDWFGGLPYEVASEEEVVAFTRKRGFILERLQMGEANTFYLLSRPAANAASSVTAP